ncbi:hypothetical protein ABT093_09745 [Kitasatospora sp. NPDC002551]|uniref:hypothetical protein n=1 Tax=Kitasatospora sp. NPDC002551 TaxID=3154539 RepID=UPI0033289952
MALFVFNAGLGRVAALAALPAANDGLVIVPLQASGLPADATLKDCATLAAVLAAGATEQTTMGRKPLGSVTVTVNNALDRVEVDAADVTWTATGGTAVGAFVIGYDPDTTAGTDADIIPLVKSDATVTPDGNDFMLTITDFYRAS